MSDWEKIAKEFAFKDVNDSYICCQRMAEEIARLRATFAYDDEIKRLNTKLAASEASRVALTKRDQDETQELCRRTAAGGEAATKFIAELNEKLMASEASRIALRRVLEFYASRVEGKNGAAIALDADQTPNALMAVLREVEIVMEEMQDLSRGGEIISRAKFNLLQQARVRHADALASLRVVIGSEK